MKLIVGGTCRENRQEKSKAKNMGITARNKNGAGIIKFDSTADSNDGIGRSTSQLRACRIRAKNTTATERPLICMTHKSKS